MRIATSEKSAATTRIPARASAIALRPRPAAISSTRPPARQQRHHLDDERLRITGGGLPAMISFHLVRSVRGHSTRASVSTSTRAAPAAISTRAHSSTVAPVVMTSSISSMRRSLDARRPRRPQRRAGRCAVAHRGPGWSAAWSCASGATASTSSGFSRRREIVIASSAAWLKPRHHSRRAMQRHRNHDIAIGGRVREFLAEELRQRLLPATDRGRICAAGSATATSGDRFQPTGDSARRRGRWRSAGRRSRHDAHRSSMAPADCIGAPQTEQIGSANFLDARQASRRTRGVGLRGRSDRRTPRIAADRENWQAASAPHPRPIDCPICV